MDIQPQNTQPISDDQELAKVLAGVADQVESNDDPMAITNALKDMATPATSATLDPIAPSSSPVTTPTTTADPAVDKTLPSVTASSTPSTPASPTTTPTPASMVTDSSSSNLDSVRKDAISDLKPIMDKLSVEPDEMFDLYLLLIRSTDDKALIQPAYAAAKKITDEARRAQALLDVIKEIDFLANK